eukprot:TRINITY_DN41864_c0_g1_i1.p1 TRINITY_DN41864_c0_g1~~TRINITY_DN41864_c0_g1_i1.p1  ORF type:complete len:167 (-),score=31.21 TRINITY_DN41864_c0_g1_i1:33-458(-)
MVAVAINPSLVIEVIDDGDAETLSPDDIAANSKLVQQRMAQTRKEIGELCQRVDSGRVVPSTPVSDRGQALPQSGVALAKADDVGLGANLPPTMMPDNLKSALERHEKLLAEQKKRLAELIDRRNKKVKRRGVPSDASRAP